MLMLLGVFIRTFKDSLYRILDALKQSNSDWFKHVANTFKCNSAEHSIVQIKPNEAGKKENHLWANLHLQRNAKSNRKYPIILPNDMVRVHVKPELGTKEHEPKWSSTRHKVIRTDSKKHLTNYLPKAYF